MGRMVIDDDTGEVTNRLGPGDRIFKKNSLEYLSQFQEWKIENFYKGHTGEMRKWMKELSINEKAFLFAVATYIGYDDCCLKLDNGKEMSTDDLVNLTGLCKTVLYETISSLIKKDIIYKGKNSKSRQYFINPWLFCKGNRINKVLKTMFKNYKIRVLGGTQWKNIRN